MMVKCDPRHGKYMACCMMYRGCLEENYTWEMFVLRKFTAGEILHAFFSSYGSVMPVVAYLTTGTSVCR